MIDNIIQSLRQGDDGIGLPQASNREAAYALEAAGHVVGPGAATDEGIGGPRELLPPVGDDSALGRGTQMARQLDVTAPALANSVAAISSPGRNAIHWAGEAAAERAWLIKGLMPRVGVGLLAGMWASGKTYAAFDLAASLCAGTDFAGFRIKRRCGTLLVAAEGVAEIPIRLRALAEARFGQHGAAGAIGGGPLDFEPARPPIAWLDGCSSLLQKKANSAGMGAGAKQIIDAAKIASDGMLAQFGMPLGLIIIDTVAAAAGFTDENSAAEGAALMNVLAEINRATGAFVLGIDHFGKTAEAGVRGSSAKVGGCDLLLTITVEMSGASETIRTLAVGKNRAGPEGQQIPFKLDAVDFGPDEDGDPITSCVVLWSAPKQIEGRVALRPRPARLAAGTQTFVDAFTAVIADHGENRHVFGTDGSTLLVVDLEIVRTEFYARYAADGKDDVTRQTARQKAFRRAIEDTTSRKLFMTRSLTDEARTFVWDVRASK